MPKQWAHFRLGANVIARSEATKQSPNVGEEIASPPSGARNDRLGKPTVCPQTEIHSKRWELTVDGHFENLASIADFVVKAARASGLDEKTTFEVQMAVDEACTNIIQHSYRGEGKGEIALRCELADGDFVVTIRDHGRPFDPEAVPPPNLTSCLAERREGMLGLYFMRQLMDEVRFRFDAEGNELTMVKRRCR